MGGLKNLRIVLLQDERGGLCKVPQDKDQQEFESIGLLILHNNNIFKSCVNWSLKNEFLSSRTIDLGDPTNKSDAPPLPVSLVSNTKENKDAILFYPQNYVLKS